MVDLLVTNESEDDGVVSTQRARAFFAAPDSVRVEQGGRRGSLTVTNGIDLHHYFAGARRYSKSVVQRRDIASRLVPAGFPGCQRDTFLFSRIAEAEILRAETVAGEGSEASVTYEPPSYPGVTVSSSPNIFWVNSRTHLISRLEGTTTYRRPTQDETDTSKLLAFTRVIANEVNPSGNIRVQSAR